jgi:CubicO group peptidase (beta-lactamase class C family)
MKKRRAVLAVARVTVLKLQLVALALVVAYTAAAEAASVAPREVTGGRLAKFKSVAINPSGKTRTLVVSQTVSPAEAEIVAESGRILNQHAALAILLLDGNRIVFEAYKKPANGTTSLLGYSMSKSVTSLVVGRALCDGAIRSLDHPSKSYVPALNGTVYADATVRHLLMMASGAPRSDAAGWQRNQMGQDILHGRISMLEAVREFGEAQKGFFSPVKPGDEFAYKNNDTNALTLVVEAALKKPFTRYFEETIWHDVGAESQAHWNLDKEGHFAGWVGLHATLRDWGRLAIYILEQSRITSQSCFSSYLKDATSSKIRNTLKLTGQSFGAYGYQFWTDNRYNSGKSFWMMGFAGQRVGINPDTGRVLVLFAHRSDFSIEVYRLFDSWQRL